MEVDRYQQNHQLYIFGMTCFLFSMGILLFFLYTLPHLLFGWHYDVPEFIAFWRQYLVTQFEITSRLASVLLSLLFLFFGLLFGYGAYIASTRIDNAVYGIREVNRPPLSTRLLTPELRETIYILTRILGVIAVFFATILLLQWLISTPPTSTPT